MVKRHTEFGALLKYRVMRLALRNVARSRTTQASNQCESAEAEAAAHDDDEMGDRGSSDQVSPGPRLIPATLKISRNDENQARGVTTPTNCFRSLLSETIAEVELISQHALGVVQL